MNKRLAQIVTVAILTALVGIVLVKRTRKDPTPQDTIYAMLDAARAGNVTQYLSHYTGQMEQALQRARSDSPDFAKYLKESSEGIKGTTVWEPEFTSENEAKARVEFVYQERNEVQLMFLDKTPAGWKISRVDSAERVKTLVPYGTPVHK